MKKIWSSIFAIAAIVVAVSCGELEPTPEFKASDVQFTATPSATTVAVSAADSLDEVLTITWADPKYAVGLASSKFRVMVGKASDNFASFQFKDFPGELSGELLGKEVNAIALKLGGQIGQPISLDVKVIASQDNNNETRESAVFQIAVTPYGDLTMTPSATAVVCTALTADQNGVSLTWSTAFAGYNGVKTYELQHSEGGTDFASYTAISVASYSRSFTQLELNNIALGYGIAPLAEGPVDFRIKATNETGAVQYSNIATVQVTPYVAYMAIGIIGDATAGGWDVDTDMRRADVANNPSDWTVIVYLEGGKSAKFRDSDLWDDAWGATGFPAGTASSAPGSPNVPIPTSGYYKVDFNVSTGEYNFELLTRPTYATIGIIGSATPGGWGTDTDLTQDAEDPHIWTGTVVLTDGAAKFRADNDWVMAWGSTTYPSGHGSSVGGSPDIPVPAGTYVVRFNDATGEYQFMSAANAQPYTTVGIIGDATAGGWGSDTDFIQNPANPFLWSKIVTLTAAEAKFRANDGWDVNWGNNVFPSSVGTPGGPNIPIATAGTYFVTFNSGTGEYTFLR